MRLRFKDLIATILFAAIAVPYAGYLINGEMPFIKDPRGMAATGLVLGAVAYLVMRRDDLFDRVGKAETTLAGAALILGIVALALAETAAAEVLLAVLMASILIVWAVELMDHAGHPARRWPPDRTAVSVSTRYTRQHAVGEGWSASPLAAAATLEIARCRASASKGLVGYLSRCEAH